MTLVMNVLCLEGMARVLLPDYNVLDGARPLLTAHRRLPRPLFRLMLPLVFSLKKIRDSLHGAHSASPPPAPEPEPLSEPPPPPTGPPVLDRVANVVEV